MKILSTGRLLFNEVVQRSCQVCMLKRSINHLYYKPARERPHVDKRFTIGDVTVIQDKDPHAVKIIEKFGEEWDIVGESQFTSVAQTVSADFSMVFGLPKTFYLAFQKQIKFQQLRKEKYQLGTCVPIKNGDHFIYFLVIRKNWYDRGAYKPMRDALCAMKEHSVEHNVQNITAGRLGCGEDGLDFFEVADDAKRIFHGVGSRKSLTFYTMLTEPIMEVLDGKFDKIPMEEIKDSDVKKAHFSHGIKKTQMKYLKEEEE